MKAPRAGIRQATLVACGLLASTTSWSVDLSCKLQYPIVLSHLWGAGTYCPNPQVTGKLSCENVQDYERYCAQKSTLADGSKKCLEWRTPDDEADLPPRDYNAYDPTLTRNMRGYGRYFGRAVVNRLKDACANKVYIADKPPYASYAVRARVLRNTVLQALRETGAAKVNLIGVSMGVQDARYMTALLPVDLANPNGPKMNTKVASVVSLVGEDGGAASAGLGLTTGLFATLGNWANYPSAVEPVLNSISDASWKKAGTPMTTPGVLAENCQGTECNLATPLDRYRWFLRSVVNLTPAYMRPALVDYISNPVAGWDSLRAFVGEPYNQWRDQIPMSLEANNGVRYMAYGAVLRFPQESWPGKDGFPLVSIVAGENDSNVGLGAQMFANKAANFENLKVMRGAPFTTGYHHTWFAGFNDAMYSSLIPAEQEPAPWRGSSADFYQQLAREMKARGL
jgi:pimeloyl-ACP methyl ester carboxylesterase